MNSPQTVRLFQYLGADQLTLPAVGEAFASLHAWLSDIAAELHLSEQNRRQILIAADEIFTNIVDYGYPDGGGSVYIMVEFNVPERNLILTFADSGIAYNPLESALPELDQPLAERQVGGLGVFMVKQLMDAVEYRRVDGRNILVLKKHLDESEATS